MSFFNELKRRNVLRVAAAYVVAAWLVIQVVETIFPAFGFSDSAVRIVTIIFGIGYLIVYPGMGNYPGLLGWTQIEQHDREVATADAKFRDMRDRYLAMPVEEIAMDPAVRKMGMRMFANNCAQCHGSDAKGAYGFPNLTDDDWLYGGTPEAIKATLINGRMAAMPAWAAILGDQGITETTAYVQSLSGRDVDASLAEAGAKHFQTYCAACHGADGKGNLALGAPNLANGCLLYTSDAADEYNPG